MSTDEQRAALVGRMAEAIEQQFDLGYTATAIDFAHVALAAVEAAGGWPRPEPIMPEEIDEIERWERVRTCRALKHLSPEALVTMQGLHPGDLDPE
jgi:hypothetical protein